MFHGVCGQVHLQAGSVDVTTVTVLALEWFVFVVLPTVRLLREGKGPSLRRGNLPWVIKRRRGWSVTRATLPAGWTAE